MYGRSFYRAPSPTTPATTGQRRFIAALLADKNLTAEAEAGYRNELDGLGKMRAGEIIEDLQALPNKILTAEQIVALDEGSYQASEKQIGFLGQLLQDREIADSDAALLSTITDSRRISRAIDLLLSLEKVGGEEASAGYLGEVGERLKDLSGEVVMVRDIQSRWGFSRLLVVKLDSGHVVKAFSSSASVLDSDLAAGDRITIVAGTVKAHEEWRGSEQTLLTRIVIDTADDAAVTVAQDGSESASADSDEQQYIVAAAAAGPVEELDRLMEQFF